MKKEYVRKVWLLLFGGGLVAVGIAVLVNGEFLVGPAAQLGGIFIGVHGLHQIIKLLREDGKRKQNIISGFITAGIGLVMVFLPGMTLQILTFIFSLYVLIMGAVKLIDLIGSIKHSGNDIAADMAAVLFFAVFGIIMLFGSFYDGRTLSIIIGIYCIMFGVSELGDFIREIMPERIKRAYHRKVRVSLPLIVTTFLPFSTLKNYQQRLDSREIDIESLLKEEKSLDKKEKPNIRVLIHVSDDGVGVVGHCDLCIGNTVLSYGNYDASSERLFGAIGDGVLFLADAKTYIEYGIKNDNQMIFSYGLRLTEEQYKRVGQKIKRLLNIAYPWKPPFQVAVEGGDKNAELSRFKDYCSRLWDGTKADFYKFRTGRFKTYCVMSTNCVLLVDSILAKAGTDIIKIVGIISPGAYYDYLQKEYSLENGIVVSREIYSKYNLSSQSEQKKEGI